LSKQIQVLFFHFILFFFCSTLKSSLLFIVPNWMVFTLDINRTYFRSWSPWNDWVQNFILIILLYFIFL